MILGIPSSRIHTRSHTYHTNTRTRISQIHNCKLVTVLFRVPCTVCKLCNAELSVCKTKLRMLTVHVYRICCRVDRHDDGKAMNRSRKLYLRSSLLRSFERSLSGSFTEIALGYVRSMSRLELVAADNINIFDATSAHQWIYCCA